MVERLSLRGLAQASGGPGVALCALALGAALLVGWLWGLAALALSMGCGVASRSPRTPEPGALLAWAGLVLATVVAAWVVWLERREHPFPNNGWTEAFDHLHRPTVFAVLCIVAGVLADRGPRRNVTEAAR